MKWKLELLDSTEDGFLRQVYICPGTYLILTIQDDYGNVLDLEIIKLFK